MILPTGAGIITYLYTEKPPLYGCNISVQLYEIHCKIPYCTNAPIFQVIRNASHLPSVNRHTSSAVMAVTRYEYVNLFHTMTDWYNTFLAMTFLNLTQQETNILLVDGHPAGGLDTVWSTLFNSTTR